MPHLPTDLPDCLSTCLSTVCLSTVCLLRVCLSYHIVLSVCLSGAGGLVGWLATGLAALTGMDLSRPRRETRSAMNLSGQLSEVFDASSCRRCAKDSKE